MPRPPCSRTLSATTFWDTSQNSGRTREPQAFASSYKTRVLPDFLSVVSDPTLSAYCGEPLLGHYENDDEGVPAQRVSVIDKGNLVNYLIGREPIRDFPASNGHG